MLLSEALIGELQKQAGLADTYKNQDNVLMSFKIGSQEKADLKSSFL